MLHRIITRLPVTIAEVTATLSHASPGTEARTEVERRIGALSETQALVTQSERIDIRTIISAAMRGHLEGDNCLAMTGPPIALAPRQAVRLSLAAHELATNALKYTLSNTEERVRVEWDENHGDSASPCMSWPVPRVVAPAPRRFGSRHTNKIVAAWFAGSCQTAHEANGFWLELTGTIEPLAPSKLPIS